MSSTPPKTVSAKPVELSANGSRIIPSTGETPLLLQDVSDQQHPNTNYRWNTLERCLRSMPVLSVLRHLRAAYLPMKTFSNYVLVFLEALSVDNSWTRLIIFVLGDPHILERGQGRENGSSNPDGILSLRRGNNLDFSASRGKS